MSTNSKMNFIISDYKDGDTAMHCKTKEECEEFCRYLTSIGRTWRSKAAYTEDTMYREGLTTEGIYYLFNSGTYTGSKRNISIFANILEWEDFKLDPFTKVNLKTGDVLVCKNKEKCIVNKELDGLIAQRGYNTLIQYNEGLENTCNDQLTIMKVYRPRGMSQCRFDAKEGYEGDLMFDRDRDFGVVEMTVEEICKALGKNIKIIKGDK